MQWHIPQSLASPLQSEAQLGSGSSALRFKPIQSDTPSEFSAQTMMRLDNPLEWENSAETIASLPAEMTRLIVWTGSVGDSLTSREPRNWLGPGRHAFDAWLDEAISAAQTRETQLLIRPHARHVISDLQSAFDLMRERGGADLGLAYDPVALLEPTMLENLSDHLERSFSVLGDRADVVILSDFWIAEDHESLIPAPPGDGLLDWSHIGRLIRDFVTADCPLVLLTDDAEPDGSLRRIANLLRSHGLGPAD